MRLLFICFLFLPLRHLLAQCNPPVTIDPIPNLCNGEPSYQLSAHPGGGVWSGPNISPSGLVSIYGLYGNRTATYIYSDSVCTDTVQAFFQILDAPSVNAGTDFSIVCGKTARVNGAFNQAPHVYGYWSTTDGHLLDPPTDMNGRIDKPGTYILTAIDTVRGCAGRDTTVCYPYLPSFPHTIITDTICQGDTLLGYTASGVYYTKYATTGPCDSFRVVRLTMLNALRDTLSAVICAGESLDGYAQSGMYTDTFPAASGCDSIRTLQLTVLPAIASQNHLSTCDPAQAGIFTDILQAANGCDSTVTTTIALLPTIKSLLQQSICAGETFDGYAQSGTYTDTFSAANGCDSVRTLFLTVRPAIASQLQSSTCDPAQVGIFTNIFQAADGCDSTVTTTISLLPTITSLLQQSICAGQSFEGYAQSGSYTDTFTAANGCDSVRTLLLTVLPAITSQLQSSTCDPAQVGIFTNIFQAANGCDSTVTTTISLFPAITSLLQQSICAGEMFEGYTQSGSYTDTFTAANGCDSIRILLLTVLPASTSQLQSSTCDPAQAGVFTITLSAANGCDSTVTTIITLLPTATSQVQQSICAGEVFEGYTQSGSYTDTFTAANGCDSIRTLLLTVQPLPTAQADIKPDHGNADGEITLVSLSGQAPFQFTWNTGDSTAVLTGLSTGDYTLTLSDANGCSAVLLFNVPQSVSTAAPGGQALHLYATPNPSPAGQPVEVWLKGAGAGRYSISVFNTTGQLVDRLVQEHNGGQTAFPLEMRQAGVYLVQVTDERGRNGVLRIVVW